MEIIPVYEVFNPITALNTIEEFIKNSGLFLLNTLRLKFQVICPSK